MGQVLGLDVGMGGLGIALVQPRAGGVYDLLHTHTLHGAEAMATATRNHMSTQLAAGVPKAKLKKLKCRVMDSVQLEVRHMLRGLLEYVRAHPGIMGVVAELPTGGQRSAAAAAAMSRAAALYAAFIEVTGLPSEEYTPDSSKTALFGPKVDAITKLPRPDITKQMVMERITAMYPDHPWQRHTSKGKVGMLVDCHVEHQADALMVLHAARNGALVQSLVE